MKKTSILIDIDDEIYDQVVEPYKKQKTFTKLIRVLLEGYYKDNYIYNYAEGELDGFKRDSITSLGDALNKMKSNLSAMGMYTEELESINQEGMETFNSPDSEMSDEKTNQSESLSGNSGKRNVELESFKEEFKQELRTELSDIIKSALSEIIEGVKKAETPKYKGALEAAATVSTTEEEISEKPNKSNEDFDDDDIDFGIDTSLFNKEPEATLEDDDSSVADDIMSDLLSGNSFSF